MVVLAIAFASLLFSVSGGKSGNAAFFKIKNIKAYPTVRENIYSNPNFRRIQT